MIERFELYVPWGQYRVVVDRLDVNYTLGEAARRREEIVRRLTAAGLVGLVLLVFATGTAIRGKYANDAAASATDPLGGVVGDSDPSPYFGAQRGISARSWR